MNTKPIVLGSILAMFLSACAHGPDVKMLEKRANYDAAGSEDVEFGVSPEGDKLIPQRTETQTTDVCIYPHEMANGDYFLGGWIRTVIFEPRWAVQKANSDAVAGGLIDVSSSDDLEKEKDEKAEQLRRRMESRGNK
ncbi:MAG: hypothetical protein AB7F43_06955 [Bacteriovoracia bacterium]